MSILKPCYYAPLDWQAARLSKARMHHNGQQEAYGHNETGGVGIKEGQCTKYSVAGFHGIIDMAQLNKMAHL